MTDPAALAERLRDAKRIVCFSGAGLSAASGLATFRGDGGLWRQRDPMTLATPGAFAAEPELVLEWYGERRRRLAEATPNAAHAALVPVTNITQNVDDLLERAGASDVVHLHGTLVRDRCHAACGYDEPIDPADPPVAVRACPQCGAPMRPAVVWFGEALAEATIDAAVEACTAADVFLVVGTSAVVQPAASLIDVARDAGATIIVVNTESSAASDRAHHEIIGAAADVLPALLSAED